MTRQEAIDRWKDIAYAVFYAEERIAKDWDKKLHEATNLNREEQIKFVGEYCEAIANEIVSNTSDEQLRQI